MRRLVVLASLFAVVLPVSAGAGPRLAGDETLSVRDLDWTSTSTSVSIRARGALIGRCDSCSFRLDDLTPNAGGVPVVTGAERSRDVDNDGALEVFSGRDVRWKIIGGGYRLVIKQGRDIDLSVVGKGQVRLRGTAGKYAINGGESLPIPPEFAVFELGSLVVVAP